jgi:hypothetical protein
MKLSALKKLIKKELLREIKVLSNSISVSPDAQKIEHQHLIDLFDGIMSKNKNLNGVRGFIDLGKNVEAFMDDILTGVSDMDKEELSEIPVLTMKRGPYEVVFGPEEGYGRYYYYLSFVKNGQIDNNELLYGAEGSARDLIQTPLIPSYLKAGEAKF